MIDAHHHFWNYNSNEFGWISDDMSVLQRDFLPTTLMQAIEGTGVSGVISVQARTVLTETEWLLELAAQFPVIKAVVGWVPLKDPEIGSLLDQLSRNPRFRGVREVIQGVSDERFFTCVDFNRGIRELTSRNIPFDLLIFHYQLASAIRFVDSHPNQRFIVDHIAKPEIRKEVPEVWAREIRELAKRPNVFCKFSGLTTEICEASWDQELLRPYFETVFEAFGPRLMFGSDWPVCLLRTDYPSWILVVKELAAELSEGERTALVSATATKVYLD